LEVEVEVEVEVESVMIFTKSNFLRRGLKMLSPYFLKNYETLLIY